ncbi:MAG: hypothetical protein IJP03_05755, partial [Christensenellaceae bacterium]|nr:hypothetical protein [Christensenellaceae bacterium]
ELNGKLLIKLELTGRGEHLHFEKSPAARDVLLPEHGGITASSRPKKLACIRINCAKKAAFGLYMDDISSPADRQLDEHSLDLATKAALEIISPTKRSSL